MSKKTSVVKSFYREEVLEKFRIALEEAKAGVMSGDPYYLKIHVSNGNVKMGDVPSISTMPFLTCPGICKGTCGIKCYAAKIANLRPSVLKSYAANTALMMLRPDIYWTMLNAMIKAYRYFRFHVSGDITDMKYFDNMVNIARENGHCEILVFTKRYNVVNMWISENGNLPENLHVLFSGWENLTPENPHNLPETNVIMPDMPEIPDGWKMCGGNCFNCACRGVGCWQAKKGETIAFKLH